MQQYQELIAADACISAVRTVDARINPANWNVFPLISVKIPPLSCLDIFCQKTGKKIGKRDESVIQEACSLLGQATAETALFYSTGLGVHPAWLRTDNKALDNLQIIDPTGYATYCLGLATTHYFVTLIGNTRRKEAFAGAYAERYWAMARCHAIISRHSPEELHRLNAALCGLLTFAPKTLVYVFRQVSNIAKSPDKLATMPCEDLITCIVRAIDAALSSLMRADPALVKKKLEIIPSSPADMASLAPSNVRLQNRAFRVVKSAEINFSRQNLEKAMMQAGNPFGAPEPTKITVQTYSAKFDAVKYVDIHKNQPLPPMPEFDKEGFIKFDFAAMENTDLDALFGEDCDANLGDDDDNEVEVRTISRSELPSFQRELANRIASIPAQTSNTATISPFMRRLLKSNQLPGITLDEPKPVEKPPVPKFLTRLLK